jgi:hypothetical protein
MKTVDGSFCLDLQAEMNPITMKKILPALVLFLFCTVGLAQTSHDYVWIQKGHALKNQVTVTTSTDVRVIPVEVPKGSDTSAEMVKASIALVEEHEAQGYELYDLSVTGSTVAVWVLRRPRLR